MSSAGTSPVSYSLEGDVAIVTLDDGKVNALTHAALDGLVSACTRAEDEAAALVLAGRPGIFGAGFDLTVMNSGTEPATGLLAHGAEFFFQIFMSDIPVVVACTGHAVAAGAITLLCADLRIGEDVACKVGLNEVAIGMAMPRFVVEMGRDRLSKRHFNDMNLATMYDPGEAVEAGYLDRLVAAGTAVDRSLELAARLAADLHAPSFRLTRDRIRGNAHDRYRAALEIDRSDFSPAGPEPA